MVNILISTYNGEKYIIEQLESIEKQIYQEYRVYIRDDGSSDDTVSIIRKYIEKNNLKDKYSIFAEKNIGFSRSFQKLLEVTPKGDYWAFCDQDDYWYPEKLQNAVRWMNQKDNSMPLMYNSRIEIGNEDLSQKTKCPVVPIEYTYQMAFTSNVFFGFAMVINRSLYDKLVMADFSQIKYHDWFAAMIVTAFGEYGISENIEAVHRQHEHNTSPLHFLKKIPDGIKLLKGDYFYTRNAREFYRLYQKELSAEQAELCKLFLNEKYHLRIACRKTFYPKRWNPQIKVELVLRILMLMGKI